MATTNPYDRRAHDENNRGMEPYCDGPYDIHADGKRAYPGFSLARLEELLRDEFARGYNCGEGTMERHVEEDILPGVKREVWGRGHTAGEGDGAADLLRVIADRFEGRVVGYVRELEGFFEAQVGAAAIDGDMALRYLVAARVLLREMIAAHHDGFAPKPPF